MSRKPVTALPPSNSAATRDPPVLRLQRVLARPDAGARAPMSFTVAVGGACFLTGEAGSGKTALLETIALARPPARGGLELFGKDVARVRPTNRYAVRRRLGVIFQDLRLIDELSSHDNIALAARAAGRRAGSYDREIGELLAWVGLARRADTPAADLDEEGRRRLAVARAVINRPDLVIADEPSGGTGLAILRLLSDLNQAGTAMLIATRDADLAMRSGAEVIDLSATSASGSAP